MGALAMRRKKQIMDRMAKSSEKPDADDIVAEPLDGRGVLAKMVAAMMTELTGFSPSTSLCRDVAERVLAEAHAAGKTVHLQVRW
jgi:hypothetical protein